MNQPADSGRLWSGTISGQLIRFLSVGLVCATVDVALMQCLIGVGASTWLAVTAGFGAGLVLNYVAHARVTFGVSMSWQRWWRFVCVVLLNYGITLGCVALSVHLSDQALPGKLFSLLAVAGNGFLLSRYWIFK